MADPHRPLYLDDPEPYPNVNIWRLSSAGWTIIHSRRHWIARKGRKLVLPDQMRLELLKRLWQASQGLCAYCKQPVHIVVMAQRKHVNEQRSDMATIEHRKSLADGGTWKRNNLLCSCHSCNKIKGALPEEIYLGIVAETPHRPGGLNVVVRKRKAAILHAARLKLRRDDADNPSPVQSASAT